MPQQTTPAPHEFIASVAEFAAEHIAPHRRLNDQTGSFRPAQLKEMAKAGLFAMRLPKECGGADRDATLVGLALEELARADLSVCFPVLNAALVGRVMADHATREQLDRWLPPMAAGDSLVCLALTEAGHGTDAAGIELAARPRGDDAWVLSGEKTSIMAATHATHALVFARTGEPGPRGITAFYIPMDSPGITVHPLDDLGCRSGGRGRITFRDVIVSSRNVVSETGSGFGAILAGFSVSRAWIALMALGVAQVCVDEAMAHTVAREAFGQPLSKFQSVTFPLVEHYTYLHAARSLSLEALAVADRGEDPRIPANMAKWWAPKASVEAAHQALLTMGHYGWSEEGPIAQRLRDVIGLQLADGTAAATKMVVARALLGRAAAP